MAHEANQQLFFAMNMPREPSAWRAAVQRKCCGSIFVGLDDVCATLQIEALRKKLRILVDHNANAPDLEKPGPWSILQCRAWPKKPALAPGFLRRWATYREWTVMQQLPPDLKRTEGATLWHIVARFCLDMLWVHTSCCQGWTAASSVSTSKSASPLPRRPRTQTDRVFWECFCICTHTPTYVI